MSIRNKKLAVKATLNKYAQRIRKEIERAKKIRSIYKLP